MAEEVELMVTVLDTKDVDVPQTEDVDVLETRDEIVMVGHDVEVFDSRPLTVVVRVFTGFVGVLKGVREFVLDGIDVLVDVPEALCVLDCAEVFDVEGEPVLVFDDVVVVVEVDE